MKKDKTPLQKPQKVDLRVSSVLSQGLDQDDLATLVTSIRSGILAEQLRKYLLGELSKLSPRKSDYDSPSWAYLQAHKNGLEEAYSHLLKLITIQTTE